jgi:hypothetical protein
MDQRLPVRAEKVVKEEVSLRPSPGNQQHSRSIDANGIIKLQGGVA